MPVKHYTIPIFIPELACPFQCVFCNQRKITGKQLIPDDEEIIQTIESHLNTFKEKKRVVEVGFFGGSFTGITKEQQTHYLNLVQPYMKSGQINGIRLSTRPDYINEEILSLLKNMHVSTIELGAQSMDDEVLKASFRGHTVKQTKEASKLILDYGFELGLQMMIGLPGDTVERSINTAKQIIELGASNTRIYPAVVIKETALHEWFNSEKYVPLTIEEAVQWTKQIIPLFEESRIQILRVGLHPSEGLLNGEELIAGPFHPSFKELVMTEMWGDLLASLMIKTKQEGITIRVPEKELNYAIGYKGKNKNKLSEYFKSVRFIGDSGIILRNKYQVL